MRNLPKPILECAQRIAVKNGVSVEAVIKKYQNAVKKKSFSGTDFFWPHSDISLRKARSVPSRIERVRGTRRARVGSPARKAAEA